MEEKLKQIFRKYKIIATANDAIIIQEIITTFEEEIKEIITTFKEEIKEIITDEIQVN